MIVRIQEYFQFRLGWYGEGEARAVAGQYYRTLRSVLTAHPRLRSFLTRCRHCRIFFLTHPRNARRADLGCPFGCRQTHRKRRSARRSADYYSTGEGKAKKKDLNGKRRGCVKNVAGAQPANEPARHERRTDAAVVGYVRIVVSLIEGWRVSEAAIRQMLARAVRQHSMARRRRIDYVVDWMKRNAP